MNNNSKLPLKIEAIKKMVVLSGLAIATSALHYFPSLRPLLKLAHHRQAHQRQPIHTSPLPPP